MGRVFLKAGSRFPLSSGKSKSQAHPSCRACWESSPPATRLVGLRGAGHTATLNQTGVLPAGKKGQEDGGGPAPVSAWYSEMTVSGIGLRALPGCSLHPHTPAGNPGDRLREAQARGQGGTLVWTQVCLTQGVAALNPQVIVMWPLWLLGGEEGSP